MDILFVSSGKQVRDFFGAFLEQQGHILRFARLDRFSGFETTASYPLVIVDGSSDADLALSICTMIRKEAQARETFLLMLTVLGDEKEDRSFLEAGANDIWILPMSSRLLSLRWRILEKGLNDSKRWARQEEKLLAFQLAAESMHLGVTITDQDGRIAYTNPAEAEMHGYAVDELYGQRASHLGQSSLRRPVTRENMGAMRLWKRESINLRKDGSSFPVQLISNIVRDSMGAPVCIVTICEDITSRKDREEELRLSRQRFRMMAEEAPVMLWMNLNNEDLFTHRWLNLTGRLIEEQVGRTWERSVHPDDLPTCLEAYSAALKEHRSFELEYRFRTREGECRWMLDHGSPWHLPDGSFAGYIGSCIDITHRKKAQEQLEFDALHDALTGLPNRALFRDRLDNAIRRGCRRDCPGYALLFIDLDNFKCINDRMGHVTGDFFLKDVARRLQQCLRPGDTVARIGGDEFTVLLEDISDIGEACRIAERILDRIDLPVRVDLTEIRCQASLGITSSFSGYADGESMLRNADTAMYRAKGAGGNRYAIFDEAMHTAAQGRKKLEVDLVKALERSELLLHYQPIIEVGTRTMEGMEAFLRWRHPERGLLSPDEFVEPAEESDLIIQLERWAMQEACRQFHVWDKVFSQLPPLSLTVNFSSLHFQSADFVIFVREIMGRYRMSSGRLILEFPENEILKDLEASSFVLKQLKSCGVGISIEDFAVADTALQYLFRLPVDFLKIDRALISGMDHKEIVIQNLILLAHGMKLAVTAEGVETMEQFLRLRQMLCDHAQGLLFSEPVDPEAAGLLLKGQADHFC